jgi:hypothetical protein
MLKEIKIADIMVGQRHRRDMGNLTTLAESIRQEGLLQPIGVTDRLELVFGARPKVWGSSREAGGIYGTPR